MRGSIRQRLMAAWALVALCALAPAWAQSISASAPSKPYTLRIHYGTNVEPGSVAPDGPKARRLEFTVAAADAGRITTRDARLDYRFQAASNSADVTLVIDLTYAMADGPHTVRAQLLLPRREWRQIDEAAANDQSLLTFVRVDPS
jgi:hypothetical protein